MKVLVDMNLSPLWVPYLSQQGIETIHWSTVGNPGARDSTIMSYALQNQLVVFTHDLDFGALLAATRDRGPSVVQIRTQDVLPDAIGPNVLRVLRLREAELARGALVTIDVTRSRVRILPVRTADSDE